MNHHDPKWIKSLPSAPPLFRPSSAPRSAASARLQGLWPGAPSAAAAAHRALGAGLGRGDPEEERGGLNQLRGLWTCWTVSLFCIQQERLLAAVRLLGGITLIEVDVHR